MKSNIVAHEGKLDFVGEEVWNLDFIQSLGTKEQSRKDLTMGA
jgi:hypothetical protein